MDITKMTGQEVMEIIKDHWFTWQESGLEAFFQLEENRTNQEAFHKYYEAIAIYKAIEEIIMEVEDEDEDRKRKFHDIEHERQTLKIEPVVIHINFDPEKMKNYLKDQIEEMFSEVEGEKDWPQVGDEYYFINGESYIYPATWNNNEFHLRRLHLGNVYRTHQEADNARRAKKLIVDVAKRRKELNGDWKPSWTNKYERRFFIVYAEESAEVEVNYVSVVSCTPTFGFYESAKKAKRLIKEFHDDFVWYFTEYLPTIN